MRILLAGGGAREHAIGAALCRDKNVQLLVVSQYFNPGLAELSDKFELRSEKDVDWIANWAREEKVDLAVMGLEDPLEAGLPDALNSIGIPTVGPIRQAAQLEVSKLFTRDLMKRHDIPGRVEYQHFSDADSIRKFLSGSQKQFALKPVGLTAGKGVKVMGVHLASVDEAITYGQAVVEERIGGSGGLIIEERLVGEEFTLQTFVDGETVLPMPLVQDFKRAFEGDQGPNTGSMGSYSQPDGLLPFVTEPQRDAALEILRRIVQALRAEGITYQGIMYGQFMMTAEGSKLIEINARFGDPEATNVLPLLENQLSDVCVAITNGRLRDVKIRFANKATVCKYITPPGYGVKPRVGAPLTLDRPKIEALGVTPFFAKVDYKDGAFFTTTSRSFALVGIADSVEEAEAAVERALEYVHGEYHVRHDIGKRHRVRSALTQRMFQ